MEFVQLAVARERESPGFFWFYCKPYVVTVLLTATRSLYIRAFAVAVTTAKHSAFAAFAVNSISRAILDIWIALPLAALGFERAEFFRFVKQTPSGALGTF